MSGADYYVADENDPEGAVTMFVNPLAANDPGDNVSITAWGDGSVSATLYGGLMQTVRDDILFHVWPSPPPGRDSPDGWYCAFCEQAGVFDGGASLDGLWIVERFCEPCAEIALRYCRMYAFTDAPLLIC